MPSFGGPRGAQCFHAYHAWLVITLRSPVSTEHLVFSHLADVLNPTQPQPLMLNRYSAVAALSFHMSVAVLQFNPHVHPSVSDCGAPRVWYVILISRNLLARIMLRKMASSPWTGTVSVSCHNHNPVVLFTPHMS